MTALRNFLDLSNWLYSVSAEKKTQLGYFSFSDSIAFLLSRTLARKAGPKTVITTLTHRVDFKLEKGDGMIYRNWKCINNAVGNDRKG